MVTQYLDMKEYERAGVSESDLLRREILSILSGTVCVVGLLTVMLVRPDMRYTWGGQFAVFLLLLTVGIASAALRGSRPRAAAVVLAMGLLGCFAAALYYMTSPAVPYYAALIVWAAFLLSPRIGLGTALACSLCLWLFRDHAGAGAGALLLWCATGLAWLALRLFHTALAWSQGSGERASWLLEESREQQGRLNATLRMLRESTDRLARVNSELAVARHEAEEARSIKEQFVANVSHELRTPLNLVVGFTEMMYLDPEGYDETVWGPELVADVGQLHRAARQLRRLIDDILDLSRIDASRLPMFRELVPVEPIVRDAVETIAPLVEQRGLTCSLDCESDLPDLYVDQTRVRQILLNLLNNAIRYTEDGGVRVEVAHAPDSVVVSVHDTGVGIPMDQLGRLFDRFQQAEAGLRSAGGAGLGLALSRQFVEMHGGRITAESEPGLGSTFAFSLPLPGTTAPSLTIRHASIPQDVSSDRGTVVVVDKDPGMADMLSRYMGDRPTLHARDLAEADALVASQHPQAVVVNCLPSATESEWLEPLGGAVLASSVPVVHCSIPSPSWLASASGFAECLVKPVAREGLEGMMRRYPDCGSILVVDDDMGFVRLMTRMLRASGYQGTLYVAYDGENAIRSAKAHKPDLVLLDLVMPGLSGFDVVEVIRGEPDLGETQVVAVTATSYATQALSHYGGRFVVTRPGGISTGRVVDMLGAVLGMVRPDYSGTWET